MSVNALEKHFPYVAIWALTAVCISPGPRRFICIVQAYCILLNLAFEPLDTVRSFNQSLLTKIVNQSFKDYSTVIMQSITIQIGC